MDRDRYAGPVGWIDANGDGEWAIALRTAELLPGTARIVAGCGIVAASDADSEVAESEAKMHPLVSVLGGETSLPAGFDVHPLRIRVPTCPPASR